VDDPGTQGLFSRITFAQPVYLGGAGGIRNVKHFLGLDAGVGYSWQLLIILSCCRMFFPFSSKWSEQSIYCCPAGL
jgi:hypothetical protein